MLLLNHHRFLYDQEFLQAGCPPGMYNPDLQIDDLAWTYATNYVIGFVSALAVMGALIRKRDWLWVMYFVCMCIVFTAAGLWHNLFDNVREDELAINILERIVTAFSGLAITAFGDAGLVIFSRRPLLRKAWWATNTVFTAVITGFNQFFIVGAWTILIYLLVAIVQVIFCCTRDKNTRTEHVEDAETGTPENDSLELSSGQSISLAASSLLAVAGQAIWGALNPVCGDAGYEDCFRSCPFPNAGVFNHSALFHLIFAVALIWQGIFVFSTPKTFSSKIIIKEETQM